MYDLICVILSGVDYYMQVYVNGVIVADRI